MRVTREYTLKFIQNYSPSGLPREDVFTPQRRLGVNIYHGLCRNNYESVVVKLYQDDRDCIQERSAADIIRCSKQNLPCYVGTFRVDVDNQRWSGIAYKYIGGIPLSWFVTTEMELETVLRCFLKLAKCVQWLHHQDIWHLKICPTTILIQDEKSADPNPVLFNFAYARSRTVPNANGGYAMGIEPFQPPEELSSVKADVFCLGSVILFWLSKGAYDISYIATHTQEAWIEDLKSGKVIDIVEEAVWGNDDRYVECLLLILQMLEFEPEKRCDMDSVVERLELLLIDDVTTPADTLQLESGSGSSPVLPASTRAERIPSPLLPDVPPVQEYVNRDLTERIMTGERERITIQYWDELPTIEGFIQLIQRLSARRYDAIYVASLAIDSYENRSVVVKHTRRKEEMLHDARVGIRVRNIPNIAKYVGVFYVDGEADYNVIYDYENAWGLERFIQFIPGQTPHPTLTTVLGVFYQLAAAVREMHLKGLIHTALTPKHIFVHVTEDFNKLSPVILGLGHVCIGKRVHGGFSYKPLYAKESDVPLTPEIDIYQLGILFYYWLSGGMYPCQTTDDAVNTSSYLAPNTCDISAFYPQFPTYAEDSRLPFLLKYIHRMISKHDRPNIMAVVATLHSMWSESGGDEPYEYVSNQMPPIDMFIQRAEQEREEEKEAIIP